MKAAGSVAAMGYLERGPGGIAAESGSGLHLSTNAYSWQVFYQRTGKDFGADLDSGLADVKGSGLDGFEPGLGSVEEVERLIPLLKKHGLEMRSIYVNSSLHETDEADRSIEGIVRIGAKCREVGTRVVVTNPNPIRWGGTEGKSDSQLRTQAAALERLGRALRGQGQILAYHNHDVELRFGAREFHHMMAGTDPQWVTLCLDAHWVYRGCGDSQVALFDVVRLYGRRISELHLRQSSGGVWSETFGMGDIDYAALAKAVGDSGARPHLVLEVAVEKGTPMTRTPAEAHRASAEFARRVFAGVGAD